MFGESMCVVSPHGRFVYSTAVFPETLHQCLWHAWDEAQHEADLAYAAWQVEGGGEAYAVYRAAQDRADAAQDGLAGCDPTDA
jgi:hypothetical protein